MRPSLDKIDCAILDLLQEQADLPNIEVARRVQLSPAAALRRVQRLRAEGVITRIRAEVDPQNVGLSVQAFVLIELAEHTLDGDRRFADGLAALPQVLRADAVAGHEDVLLHVVARDAPDLQRVLRALPGLGARRITTLLRLDTVKPPGPVPTRTGD